MDSESSLRRAAPHTECREAEEELSRHAALLKGINRILEATMTVKTEEDLGAVCLSVAEEVTGSAFGFIRELNSEGLLDDVAISDPGWKFRRAAAPGGRLPLPGGLKIHGIYGRVLRDGKGFYTNDPPSHPDSIGLPKGHPPLTSFLGVPLVRDGVTVGMIAVANREGGYGDEHLHALESLATSVAQAFSRMRAEEALRASEECFRALLTASSQVMYRMSPDWSEMRRLKGGGFISDTEAANGNWLQDYIDPDDQPQVLKAIGEAVRTGSVFELEHRVRCLDGTLGWTFSRAVPVRNASGEIVEWFGAASDVTERKRAEEALREAKANLEKAVSDRTVDLAATIERLKVEIGQRTSAEDILRKNEALLATVLETLPVGVALVDEDGRPFYLNQALAEIWDGEIAECGGGRIWQEGSDVSLLPADHPVAVALRIGEPVTGVVQEIETFTGKKKAVIASASPILMPDESRAGGVFVMQDITQQQDLQKQLLHAQKLDSIGSLAGGIAHDFNNLLTIITGYAEAVYDELEGDSHLRDELRQVLEAGGRASELTRKLLAFSRQEVAETAPMSLTETAEHVLSFVSRLIGAQVEIRRQLASERLTIRGSRGQIEQVLVNILLNARDAIADTGRVTVRTGKVKGAEAAVALPEEGTYAFVEIADTGEGISPQNLDRIFEPYFTTKEQGKGTGLGMAIAYGIVRQHRGIIMVTSAVGQGTTFTVYLPLTSSHCRRRHEQGRGELPEGRETVLVVEDEEMVRAFTEATLRSGGYRVIAAADGAEALEAIREHPVDIVLADVIMPGMNGMEMYRKMQEFLPNLKVIFVSGYSADIVTAKGVAAGEFRFLQKPVNKTALLTAIREALDGEGE